MDFKDIVQKRRSIRKFSDEPIAPEDLQTIIRAALMSPTSKSCRSWEFIVVDDPDMLYKISRCKAAGAEFVENAPLAVVVLGNAENDDVWVEDASIAAVSMQYQATELGLGSCWAQIRKRMAIDGNQADDILRMLLGYSESLRCVCVIAFGHPAQERKAQDESKLKWENVHIYEGNQE